VTPPDRVTIYAAARVRISADRCCRVAWVRYDLQRDVYEVAVGWPPYAEGDLRLRLLEIPAEELG
jgi:hypothetical protein